MRIGDLRKRIDLQAPTRVPDGLGGFNISWRVMASDVAAAIWPTSAKETLGAQQLTMDITHRVRIRYRKTLNSDWRVSWGGRYFNITSAIDPNMSHRFLDLMCKESAT